MILYVIIDSEVKELDVSQAILEEGETFFQQMDRDMDTGWQMSREWIENPNQINRCQIAADRILGAMVKGNRTLAQLMAGYILSRLPGVAAVRVDTNGDMLNTEMIMEDEWKAGHRN